MKKTIAILLSVMLVGTLFSGCSSTDTDADNTDTSTDSLTAATVSVDDSMFTDRDMEIGYSTADCETITLKDGGSTSSSDDVTIDGDTVTISAEGSYIISGSLSDGQLIVDADDGDKLQLILDGVSITNDDSAAIYIKQADKVFITTANESENSLTVSGEYVAIDDNNIDAAIFSKTDLTLNGAGSLTIDAEYGHGIVSKDDLVLTSGSYTITAEKSAISGKNSVRIAGGTYDLTAGSDGIHSEDEDDSTHGYIYVSGGDFTISAESDGFDAMTTLSILGGTFSIAAGDDGMHADGQTAVSGGTIDITECYEGIEGQSVEISSGTISIVSSDDGLNAAGGNDQSSFGGPESDRFNSDDDCYILISGGTITINASGDGIDSNGDLTISGGYTVVSGPTDNGNGTLDYGEQGTALISGGTLLGSGSSGMAETFSDSSTQCSIYYAFGSSVAAGTEVSLKDSSGNVIVSFTAAKMFQSVNISAPELTSGNTYTLCVGDAEYDIELTSTTYSSGSTGTGMGGNFQSGGHGDFGGQTGDQQMQRGGTQSDDDDDDDERTQPGDMSGDTGA